MIPLHLRKFAGAGALLSSIAIVAISASIVTPVFAAAPMVRTSAPGYFRIMLGDFEVTALADGTVDLPVNKILTHTTPARVDKALAKSFLKSPLETSVNAYLINTGGKLVLVDSGAAGLFGPTLGKLLNNLKAAGYQPEQVDEIYLTHLHPDHVGGLMAGDMLVFPNATVRADRHEADFWLSQANMEQASADSKGFFQGAMASLNPYLKAGKFKPFDGDTELLPGIHAHASKGHTAGHSTYVVESKGQKLLLIGDLIHVAAMQFDDPSVAIAFDSDPKSAVIERKKAFAEAASEGSLVGGAHLQFPGLGHVRAVDNGYQWVPVNYTQMR